MKRERSTYSCMNNNNNVNRFANNVGILTVDKWRYYINNFGCRHFNGTSKRTFVLLAKEESNLIK